MQLGELHDAAPGEVREDLQVEIDYVQALIDAVEPLGGDADVAVVVATIQQVTSEHPDVEASAEDLAEYQQTSC